MYLLTLMMLTKIVYNLEDICRVHVPLCFRACLGLFCFTQAEEVFVERD
jgi:hypothetical protein